MYIHCVCTCGHLCIWVLSLKMNLGEHTYSCKFMPPYTTVYYTLRNLLACALSAFLGLVTFFQQQTWDHYSHSVRLQAQWLRVHRFISVVCCSFEGWRCLFTMWEQGCSTQTTSWAPLSLKPVKNSLPTSPQRSLVVSVFLCVFCLHGCCLSQFWTLSHFIPNLYAV